MRRRIWGVAVVVLWSLLPSGSVSAATPFLLKQEVRIPFSFQSGSTILEPGKYVVRVFLDGNNWFLTLSPSHKSNRQVLRVSGGYADIPSEERNFEKELRLQIMRKQDDKPEGGKWIVFQVDMRSPGGDFSRLVFRVQEASKE